MFLGQDLTGPNFLECPSDHDLVLFADKVTVKGRCVAPGRMTPAEILSEREPW